MATYVPNATQATEPVESRTVESAALEFRTLKSSVNARIDDLTTDQDATALSLEQEIAARIAGDAALQTNLDEEEVFRIAGDGSLNARIAALEAAIVSGEGNGAGVVYIQTFSGTGAQTAFELLVAPGNSNVVDIYINGLYQNKATFAINASTIIFTEAPPLGTSNIEVQVSLPLAIVDDLQIELTAANVSYVPTGILSSNNVQDALDELAAEGLGAGGTAATTTFVPAAGLVSTDVQSAIEEVAGLVSPVNAAGVPFTPAGDIAATDVQAAIEEVDTEKVSLVALADDTGAGLVGMLRPETGAVARTVEDRLLTIVSALDFGADPTGVADSQLAIERAIAAAAGGVCWIPPGIYYVAAAINVLDSVEILGHGAQLNSGVLHTRILDIVADNVTVVGIEFVGGGASVYDTNGRLLRVQGTYTGAATPPLFVKNTRIRDCTFSNAGRAGVHAQFADDIVVQGCRFTSIGYSALAFQSCIAASVDKCYVKTVTPGSGSNTYGVFFSRDNVADLVAHPACARSSVTNSYFEDISWEAIDCHGADGLLISGNTIYNCGGTNTAIALIHGDNESSVPVAPVLNCRVSGNYISSNNNRAIAMSLMDSVTLVHRNVTIIGNTIVDCGRPTAASGMYGGISVASVVNCTVNGNTLTGVSPYGIMVRGLRAAGVSICDNTIERAYSTNNTAPAAIILERGAAAAGAVTVSGNTLLTRVMAPPDAYQNVYGLRIATDDNGNVRVGVNNFDAATTKHSGILAKYGGAGFGVINSGSEILSVTTGVNEVATTVTLSNVHSANTQYVPMATIAQRSVGLQALSVQCLRVSTSQIDVRVTTADGANFAINGSVTVYWQTVGL